MTTTDPSAELLRFQNVKERLADTRNNCTCLVCSPTCTHAPALIADITTFLTALQTTGIYLPSAILWWSWSSTSSWFIFTRTVITGTAAIPGEREEAMRSILKHLKRRWSCSRSDIIILLLLFIIIIIIIFHFCYFIFLFFFCFYFFSDSNFKTLQQLLFSFHFPFLLSTLTTATQTPAQDTPSIQQWNNSSNITNSQSVNTHPLLNSFYNEFQSERKFNCQSAIGPVGPPNITLLTTSIFFFTAVWRRQQIWVVILILCFASSL